MLYFNLLLVNFPTIASVHNVESQSVVLGSTNENEEGPSSTGITCNGMVFILIMHVFS